MNENTRLLILILLLFSLLSSCEYCEINESLEISIEDEEMDALHQVEEVNERFIIDSLFISNEFYKVLQSHPGCFKCLGLSVIDSNGDTIYRHQDYGNNGFELVDFNQDGYTDIRVLYMSNIGGVSDVILYDPRKRNFRNVEGFEEYNNALYLPEIQLYYLYRRKGCADENWESRLFKIVDCKVQIVAYMDAFGCIGDDDNGVFIYRLNKSDTVLIENIGIQVLLEKPKFDFIPQYWIENHRRLIK